MRENKKSGRENKKNEKKVSFFMGLMNSPFKVSV